MKKILFLTMLCVGILAPTIAQNIPSYVPTNGLVGWWPFNGNANDESGSGLNGELINESSGLTFSSDRNGNENSTIEFNSSGFGQESAPYVNISNSSSIIFNQEYSFNIWTKIGNNSEVAELINRGPDNNSFLSRFQGLNGFAFGNFPNYFNPNIS